MMGARGYRSAEEPVHEVEISQDFYIGVYPVTQAQFRAWTQAEIIEHENHFKGCNQNPAENLTWIQAIQFCRWLTGHNSGRLPEGYLVRLPTEAEWEYACSSWLESPSGRIYTEYHYGDGRAALQHCGWYSIYDNGNSEHGCTHEVGQLTSNRFGLHDMHGNVWEWCLDGFHVDKYRNRAGYAADPLELNAAGAELNQLPIELTEQNKFGDRVLRGGSFNMDAVEARAACRGRARPDNCGLNAGFRVGVFSANVAKSLSGDISDKLGYEKKR